MYLLVCKGLHPSPSHCLLFAKAMLPIEKQTMREIGEWLALNSRQAWGEGEGMDIQCIGHMWIFKLDFDNLLLTPSSHPHTCHTSYLYHSDKDYLWINTGGNGFCHLGISSIQMSGSLHYNRQACLLQDVIALKLLLPQLEIRNLASYPCFLTHLHSHIDHAYMLTYLMFFLYVVPWLLWEIVL